MNWFKFILSMSGPMNALVRYFATSAGTLLAAHGWVDQNGAQAVTGAIIALAPAIIGALTSTVAAKIAATSALPDVSSVKLINGATIEDPSDVGLLDTVTRRR